MKKSKIISLFKIIFISFIVLYVYIINEKSIYKTNYEIGNNTIYGTIIDIKISDKTEMIIKAKDKIKIVSYDVLDYKIGDYVKIEGILKIPDNNTVFNLFNYKKYLLSEKIFFICEIENINLVKKNNNIIYKIKNKIYEKVDSLKSEEYIKTFILGDKSGINDMKNIYQENGVSHLLAISGMHISLITLILSKIIKVKNKHTLISLFLIFYLFLINFTPSSIRAVSNFIFSKYVDSKKLILIILVIMLLYNPFYINNAGFLFSFIISIYLIYFKKKISGNYIMKIFKISLISFIVSIPILINSFNSINLLSPIINVIFVPFVSLIIFPLSIFILIFPFLDNILYILINILEKLSLFINNFNVELIMSDIPLIITIFYYIVITIVLIKPKLFYLLILILIIHNNINLFSLNNKVTIIDVKQGDSILLEIKNKSILIDTGGYFNSNLVNNRIIPYLKSLGIKKIEYLILTHGDYDHMGEAVNLVNNFKVEKVIFNCGEFNELELDLIEVLDKKKIPYYSCIKELNIDSNKLYFLNNKDYGNENDNSSVIYTELNNYKFLFMGDAGVEVEEDLIEKYNLQEIDVLKVGHHGSKTSSSKNFINEIKPKYSIISVGKNNRYGHPNDIVLDNLENSKIYRTDENGSIMFKFKNNKLKIETYSP
ncbi:MAG: DNA internalization-related competence protein ComEC/Rec2 [Firmicutes bacterium]|nr:DNA internalization-related competence protein ComEC/Rec2 [Bacillota bacterium]